MTPDFEEHLAHQVLGGVLVSDEAQRKAVDAEPMLREQDVHCAFVALRNRPYQLGV